MTPGRAQLINEPNRCVAVHDSFVPFIGRQTRSESRPPLIGIAASNHDGAPWQWQIDGLVARVKSGVLDAGGTPFELGRAGSCNGVCLGRDGDRYALPCRDLIADSVEMAAQNRELDGLVFVPACERTISGYLMASLRLNIPSVFLANGMIGWQERTSIGHQPVSGEIGPEGEPADVGETPLPCQRGAGHMPLLIEMMGLALPGSADHLPGSSQMDEIAYISGARAVQAAQGGLRPNEIACRQSFENAISLDMALGGSPGSVLHLLAAAREAGIALNLTDFHRISYRVPRLLNDIGQVGLDMYGALAKAGGVPALANVMEPLLFFDVLTITGDTLRNNVRGRKVSDSTIIRSLDSPGSHRDGLSVLWGNLAPGGAVCQRYGPGSLLTEFVGRAHVADSLEDACRAVADKSVTAGSVLVVRYEGPRGGPGMRETGVLAAELERAGLAGSVIVVTDGQIPPRAHGLYIGHVTPEAAMGGPLAAIRCGDFIRLDLQERLLQLEVESQEISRRLAHRQNPPRNFSGPLRHYAWLARPASEGASMWAPEP